MKLSERYHTLIAKLKERVEPGVALFGLIAVILIAEICVVRAWGL